MAFPSEPRRLQHAGALLILVAAVFLGVHLAAMPKTLEDLDSINFALGVREYDVARYQPHPPGFPVFIALAKASTAALGAAGVAAPDVRGLTLLGVVAGGLAAFPLFVFFRRLEGDDRRGMAATIVTLTAPLYWFTANRPLSDMTGLAMVLVVQALAISAWVRQRDRAVAPAAVQRIVIAAAALAGLTIGLRAQTFVLTLPLLALVLCDWRIPATRRVPVRAVAAFVAGVLIWAIPFLIATGGLGAYLAVLGRQGAADFSNPQMLLANPTVRTAAYALRDTFVLPWATTSLAVVVLTLAGAGAVILAWRSRWAFALIALSAVPYAVFDLLFQGTVHGKYALPLVPATAYLAVVTIDAIATAIASLARPLAGKLLPISVTAIVAASLWSAGPALYRYATAPSPVFEALADIKARAAATGARAALVTHKDSTRAAEWFAEDLPGPLLKTERGHEWRAAVEYWLGGGKEPVWFLARPGRTDLALFDPVHRVLAGAYRRPFDARVFTGGARPDGVDWYDLSSPGWFLDRGWSLTPEIAGVTKSTGWGPHLHPAVAYLARRSGESTLMIGGVVNEAFRTEADARLVHLRLDLDDRVLAEWDQPQGFFLRFLTLPAAALNGEAGFARLTVRSTNAGEPIPVKLEQFDLQNAGALVWGFDDGWMESEYDPVKELSWRWAGGKAALQMHNAGREVTIRLHGESPLKYFDAPPLVTVTAAGRTIATLKPTGDFAEEITVPADALAGSGGRVVLETDRTFQPPNNDPRVLALKFFELSVSARK